jgi:hypothetical protein
MPDLPLATQVERLLTEHDAALRTDDQDRWHAAMMALGDLGFRSADEARAKLAELVEQERRRAAE